MDVRNPSITGAIYKQAVQLLLYDPAIKGSPEAAVLKAAAMYKSVISHVEDARAFEDADKVYRPVLVGDEVGDP